MKIFDAEFIKSAAKPEQFPLLKLPEMAFAGRSNVGKSSLINSIVMKKKLALISSTPGKTKTINFFNVENKWAFADLPGFGYASVAKELRDEWKLLNFAYLEKRDNLKLIATLIDSRHDPTTTDIGMIEWYENHEKDYVIILTKSDKISPKDIEERKEQVLNLVSQCKHCIDVVPYSVQTGLGRTDLIGIIKRIVEL
jgi:GTP-binding protein